MHCQYGKSVIITIGVFLCTVTSVSMARVVIITIVVHCHCQCGKSCDVHYVNYEETQALETVTVPPAYTTAACL